VPEGGDTCTLSGKAGLVLVFLDLARTTDERVLAHAGNYDIASFQSTAAAFRDDERAAANYIHSEALCVTPLPGYPEGGVLYKVSEAKNVSVEYLEKPYRPGLANTFFLLDVTSAQAEAFHEFMLELKRAGVRHDFRGMVALAFTGGESASSDLRAVTCSQALILALRSAGIDMDEPIDPSTGKRLLSGTYTPARLYACCRRLVAAGRASVLPTDPTTRMFVRAEPSGGAAAAAAAPAPRPRAPAARPPAAAAARPPAAAAAAGRGGAVPVPVRARVRVRRALPL
jgi:hypothetical protein